MTRIGFDAIDVNNLPTDLSHLPANVNKENVVYLGYDDGNWPDYAAEVQKFPGKRIVPITTNPAHNEGIIGDGPPDNGTWQQWVGWVQMRRAAGADPWINTNTSNWAAGKLAFSVAGVPDPHWWVAHYSNTPPDMNNLPTIPDGALGLQCYDYGAYDISVFADYLPGIDPEPTQAATNTANEEDEVKYEKTANSATGRAGIGFAAGSCSTFQITADKGTIPTGSTWRFVIVLDSGPYVIAEAEAAPNGKAVVHCPSQFQSDVSGIITYGPKGVEYELYAQ